MSRRSPRKLVQRHADRWRDEGYVFCEPPLEKGGRRWEGGRSTTCPTLAWRFNRYVRTLGLPALSLHGLRHTHATILLIRGVHPKMVQVRLGHATYAMTMDLYSHVVPGLGKAAAEAVRRALWSPETAPARPDVTNS